MVDWIASLSGAADNGGWELSAETFDDADSLEFYAAIDTWFSIYAAGGWGAVPRTAFSGHILPDPWTRSVQNSVAPFTAFTAQEFMKRGELQGIFFADNDTPANRHQIIDMSYAKIIYELVSGHCNLMDQGEDYDALLWAGAFTTPRHPEGFLKLNIDFTNSTPVDAYEIKAGQFWTRLRDIARLDVYELYVDKTNTLNFVPHPMFATVLPSPVLDIDDSLLLEPLTIERRFESVGQVVVHGTTPAGSQISGKYPTDPQPGPQARRAGYVGASNTDMATLAERIFKFTNRQYTVTAKFAGAIGLLFEILDRVTVTYASTQDGIDWTQQPFWIHKIDVQVGADFGATTTLTLEAEAQGLGGP